MDQHWLVAWSHMNSNIFVLPPKKKNIAVSIQESVCTGSSNLRRLDNDRSVGVDSVFTNCGCGIIGKRKTRQKTCVNGVIYVPFKMGKNPVFSQMYSDLKNTLSYIQMHNTFFLSSTLPTNFPSNVKSLFSCVDLKTPIFFATPCL